jgi:hypothetical protein
MKKVLLLVLVSMILLFVFTSCDKLPASVTGKLEEIKVQVGLHEHTWADATCTAPKTCTNAACGATEGAALGHSWTAADCEHAKTCSVCNATEGEALGHNFADATCYEPKTCTVCNKTQGIALVHNWVAATCTDPKTCIRCELTEGEALGHDWKDATCTKPQTCNTCGETQGEALGHNIIAADCTNPTHCDRCGATAGSPLGHVYTYECDAWCARCGELTNEEAAHKLTHVDALAPTCFENGNVEYWTCEYCGGCWDNENATGAPLNAKSVIIPASHQDVIHVPAAEGTCVVAGNKEYWYCSVCELVWEDEALTMQSNHKNVKTDYNFNDHKLTCTIGDGAATYTCSVCKNSYTVDTGVIFTGTEENKFTYNSNGDMLLTQKDGIYEVFFNPEKPMPEVDGTTTAEVKDGWSWYNAWGAQHMFWIPSNAANKGVQGFSCANNATGFISFKMQTNVTNAFEVAVAKERNAADWSGWGTSQLVFLSIGGYSEDGIVIKAFGTPLATIPVADGWSEWFQLDVLVQLKSDNTYTFEYYVNGKFCLSAADRTMPIDSGDIRALYISGWTYATQTGLRLDDIVFGSSVGSHYVFDGKDHKVTEGDFFTPDSCICGWESTPFAEKIAAEDVKSATLKTIVNSKFKQWDQCTEVNKQGGTPVYVLAEKNGELVEGLYCSRTYAWAGTEAEQFSEFRFDVDGSKKVASISFDYIIKGSVEKNERYIFKDLAGKEFTADAYVQVKTPSNHPLAGDNYPELSGTDLVLDGEWHTMTYTFAEPLEIVNILLNLYHFQGEFILSNLVITYAE